MTRRSLRKLLIANRGEIAVRIMRSCRELGIQTVAVYSDADRNMPHVLCADEAYRIGPPPSRESYLRMEDIVNTAKRARADAIHPGYGFLAENPLFARMVADAGLTFVGPTARAIAAMGDKTQARRLVQSAGVPTVPGSPGPVGSEEEGLAFCAAHGFPVLIKAAAGGGGKGMRVVRAKEEFAPAFRAAQSEAQSSFGDGRVFLEKYLDKPRHVEFQILADEAGQIVHLGERECSIQRRHQKVVEETPSVVMTEELREKMGRTAVQAAKSCGYVNAGTIEFLVDEERNFYFLEMNTRLQVEHPVTELRTGVDLVALQLLVARGEELPFTQEEVKFRGHAIECRICAEDIENSYMPSTGKITHLRPAQGPGVREDRGVEEGGEIPVYYDSMISKLVVWAPTRPEALRKMERALTEYEIAGVKTNIPLCLFVIRHPAFAAGNFSTHFLEEHFSPERLPTFSEDQRRAVALACACAELASQPVAAARSPVVTNGRSWTSRRLEGLRGNG